MIRVILTDGTVREYPTATYIQPATGQFPGSHCLRTRKPELGVPTEAGDIVALVPTSALLEVDNSYERLAQNGKGQT